jgi:hypothetical protein
MGDPAVTVRAVAQRPARPRHMAGSRVMSGRDATAPCALVADLQAGIGTAFSAAVQGFGLPFVTETHQCAVYFGG